MPVRVLALLCCAALPALSQGAEQSPSAVVTTTDGRRVDLGRDSFQWWGVLDEDLEVFLDGANIEWLELRQASEPPPARTSAKADQKWIAVSARLRNGGERRLWLPQSTEVCSGAACQALRSLQRLQFLDASPSQVENRERPPASVTAKLETISGRAITLTAARLSPRGELEIPLSFTWEKMMQRSPSRRFFMIRPGDFSIDANRSRFWIRLWPALVSSVEKKESTWSVSVPRFPQTLVAERIQDLEGYYDGLWSRVPFSRIQKASLSGLKNAEERPVRFEGEPGPTGVVTDREGVKFRLRDLHLRRVEETYRDVAIKWLPNLPCQPSGGQAGAVPFSRLASISVTRRPDPLLLSLRLKDGSQVETECHSKYGEFEVLLLGGFHELGQVQIPLADVQEIQFPLPPAKK